MTLPVLSNSISLGPVSIHWYGLLVVVGIAAGYAVVSYLARRGQACLTSTKFDNLFFHLIIWGFIGARLYHVLNEPAYYWQNPIEILKFWNGGLAIHGAILAGLLVVLSFVKKSVFGYLSGVGRNLYQVSGIRYQAKGEQNSPAHDTLFMIRNTKLFVLLKKAFGITDLLVIGLAVGQAIGRWGNYFNQELFGKPTNGFFKVFIDAAHRPVGFENVMNYHPTFFYESVLNFVLFVVLFFVYRYYVIPNLICPPAGRAGDPEIKTNKKRSFGFLFFLSRFRVKARNDGGDGVFENEKNASRFTLHASGLTTSIYLLGYGLIRFFIDFVRIDPRPFFGGLYLSQWVSLGMVVVGVWIWYNRKSTL